MSEPISSQSLFLQLQARYPIASLVTELIQVYGDQYVVRCLIQVGGATLVTGMAAAATVEQAEDLARLRGLTLLGIPSVPVTPPVTPPVTIPRATSKAAIAPPTSDDAPSPLPASPLLSSPLPISPLPTSPLLTSPLLTNPLDNGSTPAPPLPLKEIHTTRPKKADDAEVADYDQGVDYSQEGSYAEEMDYASDASQPVDLSELIALSDVEMERIGWSRKRGQSHLKRAYGKQTRAELNEDQLLEFLHFLRALPSQPDEAGEEG